MKSKPASKPAVKSILAKSATEWRKWLAKNYNKVKSVRLIIFHAKSKTPSVGYRESIEHALCYGWIDSRADKRDEESFFLAFHPRNLKGTWSKINRERAQKMIDGGFMRKPGQDAIDHAKKIGTWDLLSEAQNGVIPSDLQKLFNRNKTAFKNFEAFAPSSKRIILEWIMKAKRPETREKRLKEAVDLAGKNIKANHPQIKK